MKASLLRVACVMALASAASVALAQGPMKARDHGAQREARRDSANIKPETVKYGVGIICDSAEQVERYLRLSNGDASLVDAVHIVNSESRNPRACGVATIAFVPNEQTRTVDIPNGIARIFRVKVVGTMTAKGWEPVPVTIQYTAVLEPSEEV
jgi:hypothetical protein